MTQNGNKKLNQVMFFNMIAPILLNGIGFFTIPLFTRLLGTENYGIYTVYLSYQSILVILMGLQTQSIIAPTSVYYEGKSRDQCFSNALTISALSCVLWVAGLLLFLPWVIRFTTLSADMVVVMMAHSFGMVFTQWALFKFTYDKQAVLNFVFSLSLAVAGILLSLWFILDVFKNRPAFAYMLGHAIPYMVMGVCFAVYFLAKGRHFFQKAEWAFCLSLCLPIVFHALSNTVLQQSAKVLLQKLVNPGVAGVFGFAVTFANVMNIIFNALNTTWVPFYHDDIKEGRLDRLKAKTNNYLFLFTLLCIGFIMAMPEVVKVFVEQEFWGSIDILPLLILGIYFAFLYTFPVNVEFYYKETKFIALGTIIAAACNMGLGLLLIPRFGIFGAAFSTVLSYALLYVLHLFIATVLIKKPYHYPYKFFYAYLAAMIFFTALFYFIKGSSFMLLRWGIFALAALLLLFRVIKNKSIF